MTPEREPADLAGALATPDRALSGKAFAGNALGLTVAVAGGSCDTWQRNWGLVANTAALATPAGALSGKALVHSGNGVGRTVAGSGSCNGREPEDL